MLWRPFFARVKIITEVFILAFDTVHAVTMATGLVKNKALIMVFVY